MMKKLLVLATVLVVGVAGLALADPALEYKVDVEFDKKATFGANGVSSGTAVFQDVAGDSVTLRVDDITSAYELVLPDAQGGAGQVLKNDGSGNLDWVSVVTSSRTDEEIEDVVGGMVTGNTETDITVTYEDGDGTLDFVIDDGITRDTEWDTVGEIEAATGFDIITSTEIDSEAEFEAILGEGVHTDGENVSAGDVDMTGDLKLNRTKKMILDDDNGGDTYIVQNADDTVDHVVNNVVFFTLKP